MWPYSHENNSFMLSKVHLWNPFFWPALFQCSWVIGVSIMGCWKWLNAIDLLNTHVTRTSRSLDCKVPDYVSIVEDLQYNLRQNLDDVDFLHRLYHRNGVSICEFKPMWPSDAIWQHVVYKPYFVHYERLPSNLRFCDFFKEDIIIF